MAVKKKDKYELVSYKAPLLGGNKRDVVVSINGETYRIKRGETVKIPRNFVQVLQQADRQEVEAYRNRQKAQSTTAPLTRL